MISIISCVCVEQDVEAEADTDVDFIDEDDDVVESVSPPTASEALKALVEKRSTQLCDDIFKTKLRKARRPANLAIYTPKVNNEIWSFLSTQSKQRDKRSVMTECVCSILLRLEDYYL